MNGVYTMRPTNDLPSLTNSGIVIDAKTQPGFSTTPIVVLYGSNMIAGTIGHGLTIRSHSNLIQGFSIINFTKGTSTTPSGIYIEDADDNVVQSSFIGIDPNGNAKGNTFGVMITSLAGNNAANNLVGGTGEDTRNIISGDLDAGVYTLNVSDNVIQGNFIGTDITGSNAVANNDGIRLASTGIISTNNRVGGTTVGARNIISGNSKGIYIAATSGNTVQGNYIGTDISGTQLVGNVDGIFFLFLIGPVPANSNLIGGTVSGAGNLISGNLREIYARGEANGNIMQGNLVGTDFSGSNAIPNSRGIYLQHFGLVGPRYNRIGGTTASARNVISGNTFFGLGLNAHESIVEGNYIGTTIDGTAALPNNIGIELSTINASIVHSNRIGGSTTETRNIISGNTSNGVLIQGAINNTIQGNFIGLDANGKVLGNGADGIDMTHAPSLIIPSADNVIGGTSNGTGNTISGNMGNGIHLRGKVTGTLVQGNLIGVDTNGTTAIPNTIGIQIVSDTINQPSNNTIGGTIFSTRNVISGNAQTGIIVDEASQNTIQGNYIGTDISGTQPLPNSTGVSILHDTNSASSPMLNTIVGPGNLINFHPGYGVFIDNASGNTIQGNTIYSNGVNGVIVSGANNPTNNAILGNSIYANGRSFGDPDIELTIDFNAPPWGVTANDPGDDDTGSNAFQNFPDVLAVTNSAGLIRIEGLLSSTPNMQYRLEFFANSTATTNPLGNGGGETFIGSADVITDATGTNNFTVVFSENIVSGQVITATATDANNNTSEFSKWVSVAEVASLSPFIVINTASTGQGSLDAAIKNANIDSSKFPKVEFNIPTSDPGYSNGYYTIVQTNALPIITNDNLTIDAKTQSGFSTNPIVVLDGKNISTSSFTHGFYVQSSSNLIQGLSIVNFTRTSASSPLPSAIFIDNADGNVLQCNFLGVDSSGTNASSNVIGVTITGSNSINNLIGGTNANVRNIISGNTQTGIILDEASQNTIQGNYIGTDVSGTQPVPNGTGVAILHDTNSVSYPILNNMVGPGNLISFHPGYEVFIENASGNLVQGNTIYSNGVNGVIVSGANNPTNNGILGNSIYANGRSFGDPDIELIIDFNASPWGGHGKRCG